MKLTDTFTHNRVAAVETSPTRDQIGAALHEDVAFEQLFDLIAQPASQSISKYLLENNDDLAIEFSIVRTASGFIAYDEQAGELTGPHSSEREVVADMVDRARSSFSNVSLRKLAQVGGPSGVLSGPVKPNQSRRQVNMLRMADLSQFFDQDGNFESDYEADFIALGDGGKYHCVEIRGNSLRESPRAAFDTPDEAADAYAQHTGDDSDYIDVLDLRGEGFLLSAQVGGPDMVNTPTTLDPGPTDAVPAQGADQWSDQQITQQIQDLRTQGLDDGAIFKQLMKMQVLGKVAQQDDDMAPDTSAPKPSEVNMLDQKRMKEQPAPVKPSGPDPLDPAQSQANKEKVMVDFLKYVAGLHQKWVMLYREIEDMHAPYSGPDNPASKAELNALAAEKKMLQKQLVGLQEKISRAGSMYKKLVKLVGPDIAKNEEIKWLQEQLAKAKSIELPEKDGTHLDDKDSLSSPEKDGTGKIGQVRPRLTPDQLQQMIRDHGNNDAFKAKPPRPSSPQMRRLPTPVEQEMRQDEYQEHMPPGKFGQVAPPPKPPPVPPPAPGAPGIPPPPGDQAGPPDAAEMDMSEDMEVEDMRSLVEVLTDLEDDVSALKEKLESGESILHGQEVEPVEDDTGSMPAGPPKIAVDQPAKKYYEDYFGTYGEQLTEDRFASIVDIIDDVSQFYNFQPSQGVSIDNVVRFIASRPQHLIEVGDDKFTALNDKILVDWMCKHRMGFINAHVDSFFKCALSESGVFDTIKKYAEGKMKTPKPKGQSDDAVKLDKLKDKAKDSDSRIRPAYLPMEVVNKDHDATHQFLELEWDPKDKSADRSEDGMAQAVISFVKGLESQKEFTDLGFLGQITIDEMDTKSGTATVHFRTQKFHGPLRTSK